MRITERLQSFNLMAGLAAATSRIELFPSIGLLRRRAKIT